MSASRGVNHEGYHGGKARCKRFCDDGTRGRPCEDFNLSRSVNNDVLQRGFSWLLTQADHLYSHGGHGAVPCKSDASADIQNRAVMHALVVLAM